MNYPESPLTVAIKGAVAGAIGTAALGLAMERGPALLQQLGLLDGQPEGGGEEPTEKLARRVTRGVLDRPLEGEAKETTGQVMRWGYGAGWGLLYGLVQVSLRPRHWLHGTMLGVVTAAVASTAGPALRLTPAPAEQPATISAMQFAYHLLYGWTTALAFRLLARSPE